MTAKSYVLAGADHFAAAEIIADLVAHGIAITSTASLDRDDLADAFASTPGATALIVVMPQPALGQAFLDIDDVALEASQERAIDLIAAVGVGMAALPDNASIVVVGNCGYLGGWGGAHEKALSGTAMGLARSAALAGIARGLRVNVVALDLPSRTPVDPASATALTRFLASDDSIYINGEIILANRGRSMLLREAARRDYPNTRPS
jgi:hypothetical protein